MSAPAGWYENRVLRTGSSNASQTAATPYVFQTGTEVRQGNTYTSTANFMKSTGDSTSSNRLTSGGVWQNSRTNPVLPQTCGLDVGLVMDTSGSTAGFNTQLKQAANTFVDALVGTPSSMSLFSFSWSSPASGANQNYPILTSVSTQNQANVFKARYANWNSDGGTNWDRGLAVAGQATDKFDAVVVITDGSPTTYDNPYKGSGSFGGLIEAENGIFSANEIKAEGTRVIAVGVGTGITADSNAGLNLRSISGQTEFNGSNSATADYYRTAQYSEVGDALKQLALGNCQGSVTVVKQVIPAGGTTADAIPAGGWTFDGQGATGVTVNSPVSKNTDANTGAANFPLTFACGTNSGP